MVLKSFSSLILLAVIVLASSMALALEPAEVLVIANDKTDHSVELAHYYMQKRGIPAINLLVLSTPPTEVCSRQDYAALVAAPVREFLQQRTLRPRIRCLSLMYGLPLKVRPTKPDIAERAALKLLEAEKSDLEAQLATAKDKKNRDTASINTRLRELDRKIALLRASDQWASLDSELALVRLGKYALAGWIANPYYRGARNLNNGVRKDDVLMVSRLDGPSPQIVRRIIDDSLAVEKNGLHGIAYFDARWPAPDDPPPSAYALYDRSIHLAAERVKKSGRLSVVIEETQKLFQPGQCPDAALYCGWYSLAKYVDAFSWRPGAVGYHIASAECATLKKKDSQVWCKRMLEKGVAATLGPVGEPYVQAFPPPEIFFGFLVKGYLTLAECYLASTPFWSWKMVLIGDPLYRPFNNP
jgi:uncharacterized protein (TIGR03790 family)